MSDIQQLHKALDDWNRALDTGDLEALVASCDPEVIICNERQPTTVGVQALRDKYGPRMQAATFKSTVEVLETRVFGDFAVLVSNFNVKVTDKKTGEVGGGAGRLVIGYRRDENGAWKMALDVDNND